MKNKPSKEIRRYIYKKIKVAVKHCPVCGEELQGNNSGVLPYSCKCGTWICVDWNNPLEFQVIPKDVLKTIDKTIDVIRKEKQISFEEGIVAENKRLSKIFKNQLNTEHKIGFEEGVQAGKDGDV